MPRGPGETSRLHLQTLFNVGVTAVLTDGQLLERFATLRGDAAEAAFAAIVERHGLMVFHACRGILKDDHQAHDAFQATFLVLLRKGNSLWVNDSLGPWLHRVACRAAVRARVEAQRRRIHERRAAERAGDGQDVDGTRELVAVLHEEVDRLPARYRVPIVLCDLQGRTYAEAARHLRCPVGTVRSRLARGRERLRHRLTRRGLAPSAAVVSAALAPNAASAAMPAAWVRSLTQCVRGILAGGVLTAGEVPASVLTITEGVLKMISLGMRTVIAVGVLTTLGLVVGTGVLAQQTADKPPPLSEQLQVAEHDRTENNEKLYHTLDLINDQEAERAYLVGDYYKRTDKVASAEYYFGMVRQKWPKSEWAAKSKTELASLAKMPRKESLPSKIMTAPGSIDLFSSGAGAGPNGPGDEPGLGTATGANDHSPPHL